MTRDFLGLNVFAIFSKSKVIFDAVILPHNKTFSMPSEFYFLLISSHDIMISTCIGSIGMKRLLALEENNLKTARKES